MQDGAHVTHDVHRVHGLMEALRDSQQSLLYANICGYMKRFHEMQIFSNMLCHHHAQKYSSFY